MTQISSMSPAQVRETDSSRAASLGRNAAITVAATGLVAAAAHVAVPLFFTPVPLTLQTLAVLFLGLLMGPRWAFATLSLYLAEGATGLPVFSPTGIGGLHQLLGPTGGFLLSYPFAAAGAGFLYRSFIGRMERGSVRGGATAALLPRLAAALVAAFVPSIFILAAGAAWLGVLTHQPAHAVLVEAVFPFLAGDAIKVCLAAAAATGIHRVWPSNKGKVQA